MSQSPHPADEHAERALLQQLAGGDRAALAALYQAYHRRLARFVGRMTRRADIVDEVINDCFWIVWQKAAGFRGDSRLSTWIMGIAYRCALKALRQHGEDPMAADEGALPAAHDPNADRELRDWIAKGLQRLPTEQRLVLELAYGGGHSVDEIAAILQCPEGTVKARMFHARTKLRHLLPALAERNGAGG
ncbi:sigma-70 family RNA polymerase sigma factor [Aquincola sp. S2]|uniref:Sigma-70 family RNA polymerase sigma factor n=1 Tax=Pseudaquabacterium terrae TaxID=2732868 RepID=A0ABX2EBV5_9BURK|nr:sigma-70 family RNA polymerase sigma factor [Aquabacterium terrae]NRF65832.1 sigma-70 family RNA polymerase sigma factor [Aquabacterium terrae]